MEELVTLLVGESLEETIIRVVVFLAVIEFIGGIFHIVGNMKG